MILPFPQLSEIPISSLFKTQPIQTMWTGFAKLLSSQEKHMKILLPLGFGNFLGGSEKRFLLKLTPLLLIYNCRLDLARKKQ